LNSSLVNKLISYAAQINKNDEVKILFPESDIDERVAKSVEIIKKKKITTPLTLRDFERQRKNKKKNNAIEIIAKTGLLLSKDKVDATVLGSTFSSLNTIRLAFDFMLPKVKRISGSFLMINKNKNKNSRIFMFSDAAVQPQPTAEQVAETALLTIKDFSLLKPIIKQKPRIALLSYSTYGSGKGDEPEKMRKATTLTRALLKKQKINAVVDGEIQLDSAIVKEIALRKAKEKNIKPLIEGDANILIFPNLSAANISYKLLQHLWGWYAIGPILQGLRKPINDLSRGCSVNDIVLLAAFTVLQINANRTRGK